MRRRAVLLPLLALAHVAVVTVALVGATSSAPVRPAAAMITHAVAVAVAPSIEPETVEIAVAADAAAPTFETVAAAGETTGPSGCAVPDGIRAALIADPGAASALAAIPVEARTVANAVMLWDGRWSSLPARDGGVGVARLREIVLASVRAAPADCRMAPIAGPRLIIVPDGATQVVLAFGSGTWTWSELLG